MEEFENERLKAKVKISIFVLNIISNMTTGKKRNNFSSNGLGNVLSWNFVFDIN